MGQRVYTNLSPEEALRLQRMDFEEFKEIAHFASLDSAHATRLVVQKDSPVDQGEYQSHWYVVDAGKEVRLENDAPYAGIIERGARPFWPPIAPLVEWAKRKGLGGDNPFGFAKAVQGSIANRGFRPKWIMRNRLNFAAKALKRAFEERLNRPIGHRTK